MADTSPVAPPPPPPSAHPARQPWVTRGSLIVLLLAILLGAILTLVIPAAPLNRMLASSEQEVERRFGKARNMAPGPPVAWVQFDDSSRQGNQPGTGAYTSRVELGGLLQRILKMPVKPLLVYLDLDLLRPGRLAALRSPVGSDIDKPLIDVLTQWSMQRGAPPLALDAGESCLDRADQYAQIRSDGPIIPFNPGAYDAVVSPRATGVRNPTARIIWSCPVFQERDQAEYSCATVGPQLFAMPSPAWFANAVRGRDGQYPQGLSARLTRTDKVCRGADEAGSDLRPKRSPVGVALTDDKEIEGWEKHTRDGRQRLRRIPGKSAATSDYDLAALAGAIVVIGDGDDDPDAVDGAKGALLVAASLRKAYIFGLYEPTTSWVNFLVVTLYVMLAFGLAKAFKRLQTRFASINSKKIGALLWMLSHEKIVVTVLVLFAMSIPVALGIRLTLALAISFFLMEAMLLFDHMSEEWAHDRSQG